MKERGQRGQQLPAGPALAPEASAQVGWRPLEDCCLPEPTRKAPGGEQVGRTGAERTEGKAPGGARGWSVEAYLEQGGESGREQRGRDGLVLPLEGPPGHPLATDQEPHPWKITSRKFI